MRGNSIQNSHQKCTHAQIFIAFFGQPTGKSLYACDDHCACAVERMIQIKKIFPYQLPSVGLAQARPNHESPWMYFHCRALEQFIRKDPDLVNFRKDDGYTPLHLAALNDHLDVVTMLIDHVSFMMP